MSTNLYGKAATESENKSPVSLYKTGTSQAPGSAEIDMPMVDYILGMRKGGLNPILRGMGKPEIQTKRESPLGSEFLGQGTMMGIEGILASMLLGPIAAAVPIAAPAIEGLEAFGGMPKRALGMMLYGLAHGKPGEKLKEAGYGAMASPLVDLGFAGAGGLLKKLVGIRRPAAEAMKIAKAIPEGIKGFYGKIGGNEAVQHLENVLAKTEGSAIQKEREKLREHMANEGQNILKGLSTSTGTSPDGAGPAVFGALTRSYEKAKTKVDTLYRNFASAAAVAHRTGKIKLDKAPLETAIARVGNAIKTSSKDFPALEAENDKIAKMIGKLSRTKLESFRDFTKYRSALNDARSDAYEKFPIKSSRNRLYGWLTDIHRGAKATLDSSVEGHPEIKGLLKKADDAYVNEKVPFLKTIGDKVSPFIIEYRHETNPDFSAIERHYVHSRLKSPQRLKQTIKLLGGKGEHRDLVAYNLFKKFHNGEIDEAEATQNFLKFLKKKIRNEHKDVLFSPKTKSRINALQELHKLFPKALAKKGAPRAGMLARALSHPGSSSLGLGALGASLGVLGGHPLGGAAAGLFTTLGPYAIRKSLEKGLLSDFARKTATGAPQRNLLSLLLKAPSHLARTIIGSQMAGGDQ